MFTKVLRNCMLDKKSIFYRNFTNLPEVSLFYLGSRFEEILHGNIFYADKTLFLKSLVKEQNVLVTRPRRWGKSLNLTMVQNFFQPLVSKDGIISKDEVKKKKFEKFLIGREILTYNPITKEKQETKFIDLQGSLPVIYLSFNDAHPMNERGLEILFAEMLRKAIEPHTYLLKSKKALRTHRFKTIEKYLHPDDRIYELRTNEIIESLNSFIICLKMHYDSKVVLLVDEYDKFLISLAEKNSKFYEYGLYLFSELFLCLKETIQNNVQFSLFTGVSRAAKTNCLSELNSFLHDSIENPHYSEFYGLTDKEVDQMIEQVNCRMHQKFDIKEVKNQMAELYNGYNIQDKTIYNPYSVIQCLRKLSNNDPNPYLKFWSSTGSTKLLYSSIKHLPYTSFIDNLVNTNVAQFTPVNYVFKNISASLGEQNKNILVETLFKDSDSFLTFMMDAGYLTKATYNKYRIPNKEIFEVFHHEIAPEWMKISMPYLANAYYHDEEIEDIKLFCSSFQVKILNKIILDDEKTPEFVFKSLLYLSSYNRTNRLKKYRVILEYSTSEEKKIDMALLPFEDFDTLFIIEYKKDKKANHINLINTGMTQIMELHASEALNISRKYEYIKKIILRAVGFVIDEGKWKIYADELEFNQEGLKSAIDRFNGSPIGKELIFDELSKYSINRVSSYE